MQAEQRRLREEARKVWGKRDVAPPACPYCGGSTTLIGYFQNGPLRVECVSDCQRAYEVDRRRPDEIVAPWDFETQQRIYRSHE